MIPKKDCPECRGTGWYGDNGPGIAGNREYVRCDCCLREKRLPVPEPVYPCSNKWCAEEMTFPASDLYWFEAEGRWVCWNCWSEFDADEDGNLPPKGISLKQYLGD